MLDFLKKWLFLQHQTQPAFRGQTFILEPILTPSGLIDIGDDSSFDLIDSLPDNNDDLDFSDTPIDPISEIVEVAPTDLDDFEEIGFLPIDEPEIEPHLDIYTSGIFTVGDTGKVEIDYLFDGGGYEGQLALFDLQGLESYEPGSREFILEVLNRILEPSTLDPTLESADSSPRFGHIVIDDLSEGAKFSGEVGERNFNKGDYRDIKTLDLEPGTHWGAMLIPNGTAEELWETLNDPDAKLPKDLRPLFSLATANPDDGLHLGQIADVAGVGTKEQTVVEGIAIDSQGNVYATGSTRENFGGQTIGTDESDIWIAKFKNS